jgi:thiamine biosynthesis lipoprotein
MATRFELVLPPVGPCVSPEQARAIGELVTDEIDEWHRRLNRFAPDSWVAHANRTAGVEPVRCDEDVWDLLVDAQNVWRESGGAFDITRGAGHAMVLDAGTRTVRFTDPSTQIDLGGIAKGHAIDCAARLLRAHGVTSAFLHGGTSSGIAIGLDPTGHPWQVDFGTSGLRNSDTAGLRDLAFSVSDADAQSHPHIVDPRTGAPVAGEASVVVVTGPSARLCDAWSTAHVVLGETPAESPGRRVPVSPGHTVRWWPGTKR